MELLNLRCPAHKMSEFSFATVSESTIYDAVIFIRSDAAGVDEIPLSFMKLLLL
jgi:hypothetical protein